MTAIKTTGKALALAMAGALLFTLAGCANIKEQDKETAAAAERARRMLGEVGQPLPAVNAPAKVVYDDGVWLGSRVVPLEARANLPPGFFEQVSFDRTMGGLQEFADRVSMRSGLPIRVTDDARAAAAAAVNALARPGSGTPRAGAFGNGPLPAAFSAVPDDPGAVRISFSGGSLKQLLDVAASKFGVSWRYDGSRVVFYHVDTRHFRIHALSGEASLQTSVNTSSSTGGGTTGGAGGGGSGGGGGGAATGSSRSQAGFTVQHALWSNMQKSMEGLLSPLGKLILSPETGSVSVTDTPDALDKIASYVERQNKILTSQVILNVTVLAVTLNDDDAYGIDWNLVYARASRQFGINTNLGLDKALTRNALSANVLDASSSRIKNTDVMIQALSEQGKVRRETAAALTALNHQPVPLVVGRNRSYVASVTRDQTTSIGVNPVVTTTITPGTFNTGFNMTLLPYIMEDGKMILQFSTELSSLVELRQFTAGGIDSVQLPELDTRQFMQRVTMGSGQTLVISGFEQTESNVRRSGIGAPENIALGGEMNSKIGREVIVIMVTPVVFGQ